MMKAIVVYNQLFVILVLIATYSFCYGGSVFAVITTTSTAFSTVANVPSVARRLKADDAVSPPTTSLSLRSTFTTGKRFVLTKSKDPARQVTRRKRVLTVLSISEKTQQHGDSDSSSYNDNESSYTTKLISSVTSQPILTILDVCALLLFAGIGKASHNTVTGAIDIFGVVQTVFPFVVSWIGTAPITGIYSNSDITTITTEINDNESLSTSIIAFTKQSGIVQQTTKGWIVGISLGIIGRGILKGYVPPIPFIIVTYITTFLLLLFVRIGYYFIMGNNSGK